MVKLKILYAIIGAGLVSWSGAAPAQAAYGAPAISIVIDDSTVTGGQHVTGIARSDQPCRSWSISYDGPTTSENPQSGSGSSFGFAFATDPVDGSEVHTVTATCTYNDGTSDQTVSTSANVTILPVGEAADQGATTPDTGGPSIWLGLTGALALLGAAVVAGTSRRAGHRAP